MPKMDYDDRTALIVVDMQNDFCSPKGNLYVDGAEELIYPINEEVHAAVLARALVVFTQDWHPPVTTHFELQGGQWPEHCVRGTWGSNSVTGLIWPSNYELVRKGEHADEDGYSAFTTLRKLRDDSTTKVPTSLPSIIKDRPRRGLRAIERIVVCGVAMDVCVKASAMDAKTLDWDVPVEVVVPTGLTKPVTLDGALSAIAEMEQAGIKLID